MGKTLINNFKYRIWEANKNCSHLWLIIKEICRVYGKIDLNIKSVKKIVLNRLP